MTAAASPIRTRPSPLDRLWSTAGRVRDRLRGRRVWGWFEPLALWLGPRLIPAPATETEAEGPLGIRLSLPPRLAAARSYRTGAYEPQLTDWFLRNVEPGSTFVDGGANVGYYTLIASRQVGESGRVYAFEPDPRNFAFLAKNIARGDGGNARAFPMALSDACGVAPFWADPFGTEGHLGPADSDGRGSRPVRTTTLDGFLAEHRVPSSLLVKMDLEGCELAALRGMRETARRVARFRLVIEVNGRAVRRARTSLDRLAAELVELGFTRARPIDGPGGWFALGPGQVRAASTLNLLVAR